MKAVLLLAFVFPGLGHLFLKKYISAAILVSVSSVSLYYLLSSAIQLSMQIVNKIESGAVSLDAITVTELASMQSMGDDSQLLDIAVYVFIFCWLISIVDSYRLGRLLNSSD